MKEWASEHWFITGLALLILVSGVANFFSNVGRAMRRTKR